MVTPANVAPHAVYGSGAYAHLEVVIDVWYCDKTYSTHLAIYERPAFSGSSKKLETLITSIGGACLAYMWTSILVHLIPARKILCPIRMFL